MKRTHVFDWSERGEAAMQALLPDGFGPCLRCGQDYETERPTFRCVCWKMRLPKRKEK